MKKWKAVRIKQELVEEVKKELEKGEYPSLSRFVSEAVQLRLQTLTKERVMHAFTPDLRTTALGLSIRYMQTETGPIHV